MSQFQIILILSTCGWPWVTECLLAQHCAYGACDEPICMFLDRTLWKCLTYFAISLRNSHTPRCLPSFWSSGTSLRLVRLMILQVGNLTSYKVCTYSWRARSKTWFLKLVSRWSIMRWLILSLRSCSCCTLYVMQVLHSLLILLFTVITKILAFKFFTSGKKIWKATAILPILVWQLFHFLSSDLQKSSLTSYEDWYTHLRYQLRKVWAINLPRVSSVLKSDRLAA